MTKVWFFNVLFAVSALVHMVDGSNTCLRDGDKKSFQNIRTALQKLENNFAGRKVGGPECKKGWKFHKNYCYYFSTDQRSWFDSERFCRQLGSSLANIDAEKEQAWIGRTRPYPNSVLWLGGIELKGGQWLWTIDFKPFSYSKWHPNEPNNSKENCLWMNPKQNEGTWNDADCNRKTYFICKKKLKCD